MINIIISGCNGKMGRFVTSCIENREDLTVVAGVDLFTGIENKYPVYQNFTDIKENADVVIDFSNPSVLDSLLDYCVKTNTGLVECTTGLSDNQINSLKNASKDIPVFFSANMSLGVNLVCELAKKAAAFLGDSFDIEIVEAHHNQKLDAPSGTALMIADSIKSQLNYEAEYEYNRHSKREKRKPTEIGMHAIRGGTIVGEHEVIFAGNDEIITISHSARSKSLFATGAVNAAAYIANKENGLYNMSDMIK